jgi:hypothetical protein
MGATPMRKQAQEHGIERSRAVAFDRDLEGRVVVLGALDVGEGLVRLRRPGL